MSNSSIQLGEFFLEADFSFLFKKISHPSLDLQPRRQDNERMRLHGQEGQLKAVEGGVDSSSPPHSIH